MRIIEDFFNKIRINESRVLILLVALVFLMKLVYILFNYYNAGTTGWDDDFYYLSSGEHIASGDWTGSPSGKAGLKVGPVVPGLIAFFIKVFGNPVIPFYIYNVIVTVLLIPVLFYLGKELFNNKIGWLIAIWGIFTIEFIKYTPRLLKEPTLYFLIPLTLLLLIKSIKKIRSSRYFIFSGISYTLLIHTDERYFIYLPIFALAFFLNGSLSISSKFRSTLFWIGFVFLLMLPWGIRNYKVFGQVVLISPRTTSFTSKLWGKTLGGFEYTSNQTELTDSLSVKATDTGEIDEKQQHISLNTDKKIPFFRTLVNVWQPAYFKAKHVKYIWWEEPRLQKWSIRHNVTSIIFYGVFLPFYFIGFLLLFFKKNPFALFLGSIPIFHSFLHAYTGMPEERYRYPIVFIIVLIGIWTFFVLFDRLNKDRPKEKKVPAK